MRTLSNSRVIPWSGALCAIALLSCQTYDFEPVEPLAMAQKTDHRVVISRKSKPNMMLVVDKSGSMLLPSGSGTRLSEMKSAMQTFLSKVGTKARIGLTVFPNASDGNTCQSACPPGIVLEPITTTNDVLGDLEAQASTINARIQAINTDGPGALPAAGGTPTAATLNVVSNQPTLIDPKRDNFVLLLTDGQPNCNNSLNPATCTCTSANCTNQVCSCLDQDASVLAIKALKAKGIRTIVVGFGTETGATSARAVLNAMADEGDFARTCVADADCGAGDTCDLAVKKCSTRFYQAADAAELASALEEIATIIPGSDPCLFELESKPEDPQLLAVYVGENGAPIARVEPGPDTWSVVDNGATGAVKFTGALCTSLLNASESNPVTVELRLLEPL